MTVYNHLLFSEAFFQQIRSETAGLDNLRAVDGILDVLQSAAFGKKGRLVVAVQVLCRPDVLEDALNACFLETTTLGVRWHRAERAALGRALIQAGGVRVKSVIRPDGRRTGKPEADDLQAVPGGHAGRQAARRQALKEDPS